MIEFALPWIFVLLPLPWLVRRLVPTAQQQEAALRVPASHLPFAETMTSTSAPGGVRLGAATLCWILLVLAAAQPRWIGEALSLPTSGRDLMLAVDISESMELADMRENGELVDRLTATRNVVREFVARRTGDRLGLILFGSEVYVHVPLTFDRATLARLLDEARIGFAGQATAIGDAIGLAVKRLRERPDHARVLVLMTDGANTAGNVDPVQAAELAAQTGVRIYTIGIGAEELEISGPLGFFNRTVNPSANLDEKTLQRIAELTGGGYFRARDSQELDGIYALLDELEPVEQDPQVYRPVRSLAHWPLALALLISLALAAQMLWPRLPTGAQPRWWARLRAGGRAG